MQKRLICLTILGSAVGAWTSFVQYDFSLAECLENVVEDVAGDVSYGDLMLNMSSARCLDGVGVQGHAESPGWPVATSTGNSSALIKALRAPDDFPGLSFELWFSLGNLTCPADMSQFCEVVVLSIGSTSTSQSTDVCGRITDLEIMYSGIDQRLYFRHDTGGNTCRIYECTHDLPPSAYPFHLVLTIDEREVSGTTYMLLKWFINGTRVNNEFNSVMTPTEIVGVFNEDYKLQLLDLKRWADSFRYWPFEGRLFSASIHVEVLSGANVSSFFAAGVLNSMPIVRNMTTTLAEDGEVGDHYDDPQYYLAAVPGNELEEIHLDVYDADEDPYNPNYGQEFPAPRVFVASLPLNGTLLNSSGQRVTSVPFEVTRLNGEFTVRYRPRYNEASPEDEEYARFTFYAKDSILELRSTANATVIIRVLSKNDPPVAFNASHVVNAGTTENIIPLVGIDLDADDYVHGAVIVVSPARGKLYQVFDNGSASNTIIEEGQGLWRQDVAYGFDEARLFSNLPGDQTVGNDTFGFSVFDSDSNSSETAFVNVTVSPGVWALPTADLWSCFEDTECAVNLYGNAAAEIKANVSFTITGVPAYGHLLDGVTNTPIDVGTTLSTTDTYPYDVGLHVIYYAMKNFFTTPGETWNGTQPSSHAPNDTLSFYTSIELGNATLSSTPVEQLLQVTNVNDNSSILCYPQSYGVRAIGEDFDDLNGTIDRPDQAIFRNISVTEEDNGVDAIRVDIMVDAGMVSVNDLFRARLNFRTDCDELRNVRCKGQGERTQDATFIGEPGDVEDALNGMVYESYYPNIVDNVTITTYDGSWGECLGHFRTTSVRTSCARSTCSILVDVGDRYVTSEDSASTFKISWMVVVALVMLIGACIMQMFCCGIRAAKTGLHKLGDLPTRIRHFRKNGWKRSSVCYAGQDFRARTSLSSPGAKVTRPIQTKGGELGGYLSRFSRRRVAIDQDLRQGPVAKTVLSRTSLRAPPSVSSWGDD